MPPIQNPEQRIRRQLVDCLKSIRDSIIGLTTVTRRKAEALVHSDLQTLEATLGEEETYGRRLAELNAERQLLYGSLVDGDNESTQAVTSRRVLEALPAEVRPTVAGLVDDIRQGSRELRRHVAFNITLARRSAEHVQGLIKLLYGSTANNGYDNRGRRNLGQTGFALVNSKV